MDKESTQLYCIYDPVGKAKLFTIARDAHDCWCRLSGGVFILKEVRSKFIEKKKSEGYTCKPIQIANLEEEVVLNLDDERLFY